MLKDTDSQSKRLSNPNELSKNCRKGAINWGGKAEKGRQLKELEGD